MRGEMVTYTQRKLSGVQATRLLLSHEATLVDMLGAIYETVLAGTALLQGETYLSDAYFLGQGVCATPKTAFLASICAWYTYEPLSAIDDAYAEWVNDLVTGARSVPLDCFPRFASATDAINHLHHLPTELEGDRFRLGGLLDRLDNLGRGPEHEVKLVRDLMPFNLVHRQTPTDLWYRTLAFATMLGVRPRNAQGRLPDGYRSLISFHASDRDFQRDCSGVQVRSFAEFLVRELPLIALERLGAELRLEFAAARNLVPGAATASRLNTVLHSGHAASDPRVSSEREDARGRFAHSLLHPRIDKFSTCVRRFNAEAERHNWVKVGSPQSLKYVSAAYARRQSRAAPAAAK